MLFRKWHNRKKCDSQFLFRNREQKLQQLLEEGNEINLS